VLRYPAIIRELDPDEGGGFLAEIPDLPGCIADGETVQEALTNVENAVAEWIAAAEKLGRSIPDPPARAEKFSGKWVQRVPRSLHRRLSVEAKREGVSLNALATTYLAQGVYGGVMEKKRVA
jgi:antitoxin HicB